MRWLLILSGLIAILLYSGAPGRTPAAKLPTREPVEPIPHLGRDFDASRTGKLVGHIRWEGPRPTVPGFRTPRILLGQATWLSAENPLAPQIQTAMPGMPAGVAGVLIELRGVRLARSKEWNLGPVTVHTRNTQIGIEQDGRPFASVGVVRRGESVRLASEAPGVESLRARGAAFFTLAMPSAGSVAERKLDHAGLVEWSSAVGNFWARAYVAVSDHPYWAVTDAEGKFELSEIPEGEYEWVATLPSWRVVSEERDPELMWTMRQTYAAPVSHTERVRIAAGERQTVRAAFRESDFPVTGR
ncbi:hypothetical protein [Tuwongella immobilis]|uniref:Carboxypeptidase regulatory-like domain-containing protein n=1 Tax=Tuwongella immobilis TaxID=692036 RepID=A0A6C2YRD5_9BACT|nr:hypothetical protein [Tuwongella immobilis]VIP04218.1 unnamed protein product [Tuwongella immobilis]VTS05800.1 unnamed protein product [Tuwongella immobilis]